MEKEKFYVHNKLLSYRDITSNNYLELSVDASSESGSTWVTFNPSTICISIYDPKVNKNVSTICICLRYNNVVKLIDSVNGLLSMSNSNAFTTGAVIQIPQYTLKNRKELILNFASNQDNQPIVQLTIVDTASQRGRSSITLDKNVFVSIGRILKEFSDNPIATNIGLKQLLSYDRLLENLNSMKDEICTKLEFVGHSIHVKKDTIDVNEYNEEPSQMSEMQEDFEKEFANSNGFSNVDLGLNKVIKEEENKNVTKIDQPFISTCLNHDLHRLEEWTTSFICTDERSTGELFVPFDVIFNNSNITLDDRKKYIDEHGYYNTQYLIMVLLKKYVKEAINTGAYPTCIPALRFENKFKKDTNVYKLSKDIITIFLLYSIIINNFSTDNMKRTYFIIKLLFSPFMFSIDITDNLIDELCIEYEKCNTCGMLDTIKDKYTSNSYGGSLNISREVFESCCKSFISTLKTKETFSISDKNSIDKLFKDFKVEPPKEKLNNGSDIRNNLFNTKIEQKEPVEINIENQKIKDFEIKEDERLKLFIDSARRIDDGELIKDMKNICKSYEDLTGYFKTKDIPAELFKIKRVLDKDITLRTVSQVLKQAKLLKEDEDVTVTRVIQDESVDSYNENFDVQDILSMEFENF